MKNDFLFFLVVITLSGDLLYLLWKRIDEKDTTKRMLRYVILHSLIVGYIIMLVASLCLERYLCRNGKINWLMTSSVLQNICKTLLWIWIIGAMATLLWYGLQHVKCAFRYYKKMPVSKEILQIVRETAGYMGISEKKVRVWQLYGMESPELGGWFRPVIYLPKKKYDKEVLSGIITHELVHYQSGDRWIRELGMIMLCFYWFNPLAWQMVRELKYWDEYHCDYRVCGYEHIDRGRYIYTLCEMILEEKKILTPYFAESRGNITRRIEYMESYQKMSRKKWIVTVASLTVAFVLVGSGSALAAGLALNTMQNKAAMHTMVGVEESLIAEEEIPREEYTMSEEAVAGVEIIKEESVISRNAATIDVKLKNQMYVSADFDASVGDYVTISIVVDPDDVVVKVGIIQPDGLYRYVSDCGDFAYTFSITMDGTHRVFIWNQTDTKVGVIGHYNVK